MSKNQIIIALVVLCLVGTIWGSVQDKKSTSLERQLAAMKAQPAAVPEAAAVDDSAVKQAQAELEDLKAQNKKLLEKAATLKGTISSQKDEIAALQEQKDKSEGSSEAVAALQGQVDKQTAELTDLEEKLAGAQALCAEKETALAAAEEALAGLEEMKSALANSVDEYSSKSQELSAEVEEAAQRVHSLENALEERTKLLVSKDQDLARTTLNMNILLSKIAAQNNSLAILEETRVAMTKELAAKFLTIQELEHKLSAQVPAATTEPAMVEETVTEEVSTTVEEAPVVEPHTEEAPAAHH